MSKHRVTWHDRGREPECPPNPAFPNGATVDFAYSETGAAPVQPFDAPLAPIEAATCQVALPYPATRCGTYVIECAACGQRVGCTTAGRPDDPRLARLACQTLPGLPQ